MQPVQRPLSWVLTVPLILGMLLFSLSLGYFVPFTIFVICLSLGCWLYAMLSRYGIELQTQVPSRVTEGDNVELSLLLKASSWLPKFICLSEAEVIPPHTQEGGRGRRRHQNLRLVHRELAGLEVPPSEALALYEMHGFILHRGITRIHRELAMTQRGVTTIHSLRLYLSDPLGMFSVIREFRIDHEILVRVRPSSSGTLLNIAGAAGRLETQRKVGDTGEMTEFAGTRPYRPGDELRHIHWPMVARTGELYVREYTQSSAESVVVLVLRNRSLYGQEDWQEPAFGEYMLKLATTMVIELFNRRVHVAYGHNVGEGATLTIGYSQRNLQQFHDDISALSWVVPATNMAFLDALEPAGMDAPSVTVFCIDAPLRDDLAELPQQLHVDPNRVMILTPQGSAGQVPRGLRFLECRRERPDEVFARLEV